MPYTQHGQVCSCTSDPVSSVSPHSGPWHVHPEPKNKPWQRQSSRDHCSVAVSLSKPTRKQRQSVLMPGSSSPFNASISSSIPGFSIDLRFREDRPANPVQMYSSILFLMSKVFQYAWENTVPGEIYYGTSMWDLSIFCSPNTQLRQLRAMHVFHALLDIGNTIATSRQFFEFQCGLLLHGQNIGNVTLKVRHFRVYFSASLLVDPRLMGTIPECQILEAIEAV